MRVSDLKVGGVVHLIGHEHVCMIVTAWEEDALDLPASADADALESARAATTAVDVTWLSTRNEVQEAQFPAAALIRH